MSSFSDSEYIQRCFIAKDEVKPESLGRGKAAIRGSSYFQGPTHAGDDTEYTDIKATMMLAPLENSDTVKPLYSLWVRLYARIQSYLRVDILIKTKFLRAFKIRTSKLHAVDIKTVILRANVKNFQIPHPLKKGKDLVHSCLEGPENGVYFRGRLRNKNVIDLPDYWTGLVHEDTITVQLQPIGSHQDIIIKRIGDNQIHLQSKGGMPIDCFYHIYGERKDVEKLKIEVDKENG